MDHGGRVDGGRYVEHSVEPMSPCCHVTFAFTPSSEDAIRCVTDVSPTPGVAPKDWTAPGSTRGELLSKSDPSGAGGAALSLDRSVFNRRFGRRW